MSEQNTLTPHPNEAITPEAIPPLWNPGAAASWSLLFGPMFGAYLHMKNWETLGQSDKASTSKKWVVANLVFLAFAALISILVSESKGLDVLTRFAGVGLLIGWYYAIGKSQQAYVLGHFGKSYPRRGWSKPLFAALGILMGFIVVIFIVGLVYGAMLGTI
jgi:hypothetical protein